VTASESPRPGNERPAADRPEITGLVIPVPDAQPFATHPHVTLVAPFGTRERVDDAALHDELRAYFASVAPFDFELVEVRKFPAGFFYLAPEPASRFRAMTKALAKKYPDYPPYEGQFRDVIPHLTLDEAAEPLPLPIRARATVAQLVYSRGPLWEIVEQFRLTA
jgi:2'-5' RNA ligase